jgi:agmatine/peptidylarginine deiminase
VPILGLEEDEQAMEQLGNFFPTYHKNGNIIPLPSEEIIKHGSALNCISWTVEEF